VSGLVAELARTPISAGSGDTPGRGRGARTGRRPWSPCASPRVSPTKTTPHPAHIPREVAGSSHRRPEIPASQVAKRPAHAGNPRPRPPSPEPPTGLSRRRSRVRVPSLPLFVCPANDVFCCLTRHIHRLLGQRNGQQRRSECGHNIPAKVEVMFPVQTPDPQGPSIHAGRSRSRPSGKRGSRKSTTPLLSVAASTRTSRRRRCRTAHEPRPALQRFSRPRSKLPVPTKRAVARRGCAKARPATGCQACGRRGRGATRSSSD
jgi:hypothetical protein